MANPSWPLDKILEQIKNQYEDEGLENYWVAEEQALEAALEAIANHLPGERYSPSKALGVGGAGIVLRLTDRSFPKIDKALKFPRPVEGKVQLLSEMLRKEISYLAELRHPGIVRVVYHNTLAPVATYQSLPFYLMEFVDGAPSRDFARNEDIKEEQFRDVVRQSAEAIAYLHNGTRDRFAHLDIKTENILVTSNGQPVIIDLGTCKRLQAGADQTIVACTRSNAHPQLVRLLTEDPTDRNRAKGEVRRSEIDPCWDMWAFALTLLDWLGVDRDDGSVAKNGIYHRLESYTRKYYMLLAARLLSYGLRSWLSNSVGISQTFLEEFGISSAEELCDVLSRLDGGGPLTEIEELGQPSSGTFQAAPGTHVASTPALLKVLEHPLYRRLNSISQLGVVSQVYTGAKHTRREHSLGTYANTGRILSALYEDSYSPFFRQTITDADCRAVLLAALLHDIGQFPLAHDLEEIDKTVFNHADLTTSILKGKRRKKKKGSRLISFEALGNIFEEWRTTPERVLSILSAKPTSAGSSRMDKLLRSIFSGPIDGDKINYLLKDAAVTDVPYPLGIDVDRLLRCMTTVVINEGGVRDVPMIGVHAKGKIAAEFLTLARYAMFSQVYWHHTVRAQKAMLFRAVAALLTQLTPAENIEEFQSDFIEMVIALPGVLYHEQPATLFPELDKKKRPDFGTFGRGTDLAPTDAAVLAWLRQRLLKFKRPEAGLIEGILSRNLFKRLWVVSYDMEPKRWESIVRVWDQLGRRERQAAFLEFERAISKLLSPGKTASVTKLKADKALEIIAENISGETPWLTIDIPGDRPGSEVGLYYVLEGQRRQLRKNDRAVGELQSSQIWEEYAHNLRRAAGKIRIFCDPALVDTVEESIDFDQGIDSLEDAISSASS